MRSALLLTMGFFENRLQPLRELAVYNLDEANFLGLITQAEYNVMKHVLGSTSIPDERGFKNLQAKQLANMQAVALS